MGYIKKEKMDEQVLDFKNKKYKWIHNLNNQ